MTYDVGETFKIRCGSYSKPSWFFNYEKLPENHIIDYTLNGLFSWLTVYDADESYSGKYSCHGYDWDKFPFEKSVTIMIVDGKLR